MRTSTVIGEVDHFQAQHEHSSWSSVPPHFTNPCGPWPLKVLGKGVFAGTILYGMIKTPAVGNANVVNSQ